LGAPHPLGQRLTDSQKCFRTQDIEEVGDNRHTTFFEMLGNWSLGDYFKKEQISWMFEFLTSELGLDPERIYVSVFRGLPENNIPRDDEAVALWQQCFASKNIDARVGERIFLYSEKKNWWSRSGVPANMPVGEPGGPDSEMFWDFGAERGLHEASPWKNEPCHVNCDCGRYLEIGNNVFMEYLKTDSGFAPLPKKNVDFGGGLERMMAAVSDDPDIFRSDLFSGARAAIERAAGKAYGAASAETFSFRVVLDHIRAATFLISDGVLPSNKDQGYFVRRLIRRAVRFARSLGVAEALIREVAGAYIDTYKEAYPELSEKREQILKELEAEETKFARTLEQGLREFQKIIEKNKALTGVDAFYLYQSFGFPLELTEEELARTYNLKVDEAEFRAEFKKHQDLSRTASAGTFKSGLADHSEATTMLHTATHLLQAALRKILGDHVEQRGSNITHERLRFDFSHSEKVTPEQLKQVEALINDAIARDLPVTCEEMSVEEAKVAGAMGLFEQKYGERVKVYSMGDFSKEICGGPHVTHTGVLKSFQILKEEASSAGIRRIKAIVGGLKDLESASIEVSK
ncbi:MAG: alanine--tRNA ligase, partial [bacterium]